MATIPLKPVCFSITLNGEHCGNFHDQLVKAEGSKEHLDRHWPEDVREIVPLVPLDEVLRRDERIQALKKVLSNLSFAAQISGGVAGRDDNLVAAIEASHQVWLNEEKFSATIEESHPFPTST